MDNNIERRKFLKGVGVGAVVGTLGTMGTLSLTGLGDIFKAEKELSKTKIGTVKKVTITNISETSWFDNNTLVGDIKSAGGLLVNQYNFNWAPFANGKGIGKGSYQEGIDAIAKYLPHDLDKAWEYAKANSVHPENAGGFSALIDFVDMQDKSHKILLDSGWSYEWMESAFKREGIDKMLENREIEALILSHEHFDHFWGLPVTLKYDPGITIYIPEGFYEEGLDYIKKSGHTGKLITLKEGINTVYPGMALYVFGIPIITRVYGEQSLYFNVEDKGLVSATGCCHQGIIQFASTAINEIEYEKNTLHGIYGGLHISPFDDWDPKYDDLVFSLGDYGFEKIGCNHCTGLLTANKFVSAGLPVVKGTARYGSKDTAYLGNGDTIEFGVKVASAELEQEKAVSYNNDDTKDSGIVTY